MTLVEEAIQRKKELERAARRGRGSPFDEVWCMFDVNGHARLPETLHRARDAGIRIAVSNPCLELWFLLHFDERTGYIDGSVARRLCEEHLKCGKRLTSSAIAMLLNNHDEAAARARRLQEKHLGDGSDPYANPSSSVWQLIDSIRGA